MAQMYLVRKNTTKMTPPKKTGFPCNHIGCDVFLCKDDTCDDVKFPHKLHCLNCGAALPLAKPEERINATSDLARQRVRDGQCSQCGTPHVPIMENGKPSEHTFETACEHGKGLLFSSGHKPAAEVCGAEITIEKGLYEDCQNPKPCPLHEPCRKCVELLKPGKNDTVHYGRCPIHEPKDVAVTLFTQEAVDTINALNHPPAQEARFFYGPSPYEQDLPRLRAETKKRNDEIDAKFRLAQEDGGWEEQVRGSIGTAALNPARPKVTEETAERLIGFIRSLLAKETAKARIEELDRLMEQTELGDIEDDEGSVAGRIRIEVLNRLASLKK